MGVGHNMKEQSWVKKNIFCAQLPEMMSLYGHINASLCTADIPMQCPCYDECVDVLELLFRSSIIDQWLKLVDYY